MCRKEAFSWCAGLLICFLQITSQQTSCAANNEKQACAPSSCGKITNIKPPFRLKGDPEACGDPGYELVCENNVTVISLFSGKYHVKAINYNNFTIRLVDPGIQEADCSSLPRYILSSPNFTDSYIFNLSQSEREAYESTQLIMADGNSFPNRVAMFRHVIYLNCSSPVRDDPQYVDTSACVNLDSKGHLYAIAGSLSAGAFKVDCRVKQAAATSAFHFDYSYEGWDLPTNQNYSYPDIHKMLIYGFDVSWMSRPCGDLNCDPEGSICILNKTSESHYCYYSRPEYCESPLGFSVGCRSLSKLRIFLEAIIFNIAKGLLEIIGVKISDPLSNIHESKFGIKIGRVTGRYVLSFIIVRFLLGLTVFFGLLIYTCHKRHTSIYENIEEFLQGNTLMPIRYSYNEIKKMACGFKDKIGERGYGSVYKGKLRSGPFVAIKMLGKSKANGQDFINEVATIGRIHHSNVLRLIGFCADVAKRALVYEFMPNGSLDRYIFSKDGMLPLTYEQIYKISLGVARGIAYLHQGCDMQILHFDIKPQNILLDENFIPKVSDFGLAKLYPTSNSIVTLTAVRGTIGYMALELFYQNIGGVSSKADVYSFGMLLIEMASKRRNLNPHVDHSSQLYFPFWIYNQLVDEREIELREVTGEEKNNVKKMFIVALWCIQLKPNDRPSMNRVIEMLEGDVKSIEMPPRPSLYPTEMIQGVQEIDYDETISNDANSSSVHEEIITDPLLMHST